MIPGEIVWVDFDPALGHEQKGRRPAVVLSVPALLRLGLVMVAPLTQGGGAAWHRGFTVEVSYQGKPGRVLVNQLCTVDTQRVSKVTGDFLSEEEMRWVKARLAAILELPVLTE